MGYLYLLICVYTNLHYVYMYTVHSSDFIHTSLSPPLHSFSQNSPHSVPLGVASQNGHTQTVQRLVEGGANVNHQDTVRHNVQWKHLYPHISLFFTFLILLILQLGFTALVYASQNGHMEVVQMLLGHGADANICTLVCWLYILMFIYM